jgi:predicted dehydrogenase
MMDEQRDIPPDLPKDRSVGIGCIGAGFIMADCHLVAYREAGLNPVAITSRAHKNAAAVAKRHSIPSIHNNCEQLLDNPNVTVVDVAVPPDIVASVVEEIASHPRTTQGAIRGLLVQKPFGRSYAEAKQLVELCRQAGLTLAVNQNMRWDQSVRYARSLIEQNTLGQPVLATIDMRAIPHWMPWQQRQGWLTCRIMSIHHLDTMRYWFGTPERIYASFRTDPRTAGTLAHTDGICLYTLEYSSGLRCSIIDDVWTGPTREGAAEANGIHWRVEGTTGLAQGTIGWPRYPQREPSTINWSAVTDKGEWHTPHWDRVWFPDAFAGPMGELLCALEQDREPTISGNDNLSTMALVDAAYRSNTEHRAISLNEVLS